MLTILRRRDSQQTDTRHNDNQHTSQNASLSTTFALSVIVTFLCYDEDDHTECRYAECCFPECRGAIFKGNFVQKFTEHWGVYCKPFTTVVYTIVQ